jgi:flavin-binding protein dodecin
MPQVAKIVTVTGSSPDSFAQAAQAAVEQAEAQVKGATSGEVASMHVTISGGKITEYRTTLRVSFGRR